VLNLGRSAKLRLRGEVMKVFVIMPFQMEFEDVYQTIKGRVKEALAGHDVDCSRLDEIQAAGRITARLLEALDTASLCIADLTGLRPNIMWEVGYAMALKKPTILLTQAMEALPFDIGDMQSIRYDRGHLNQTLAKPLEKCVRDTASAIMAKPASGSVENESLVGELREEIRSLKDMVSQAVKAWSPVVSVPSVAQPRKDEPSADTLKSLEGAWHNEESNTYLYARVVGGELVCPYCYGGDGSLTAVYYGWRRIGEYWFARFRWLARDISGFAFLKQEALDSLVGAWWYDQDMPEVPECPEMGSGTPINWKRRIGAVVPAWAERFLEDVRREGLVARLACRPRPRA
jgi:nucleoside 2-deoxyribosyltransferase